LRTEKQHGNAQAFCRQLATDLNFHHSPGYQSWLEHIEAHHDDNEVLTLFSQYVLRPLDDKALQVVLKSSAQTALLVAVSPLALVDMLLVLWRNFKMLRDIARLYQVRLSYWGQIHLIRQILKNMVFAGAAELVTEFGSDWFSAELTSKLSAKLAQGVGSGLLSARLGINTIQVCRPLLLLPNEKPKLSQIRRSLLKQLTSTLSTFFTTKQTDDQKR
jgi:putative membrane protein